MADCRDLETLLAPYVDGEARPIDCAAVDAHLRNCPPCRDRAVQERAIREAMVKCREQLRSRASDTLRRRCEACRPSPAVTPAATRVRRPWVPLSMAATLVLAVAGVFLWGLKGGSQALAAQLVVDHVKCFEFAPAPTIIPDAAALSREWAAVRGWSLKIPESTPSEELQLLEIRRCISTRGLTAHVMYRWHGQPLSVYVLNSHDSRIGPVPQIVERLGEEAIMWSKGDRTYAVVTHGRATEIEHVAQYVRTRAE
jgi:anti-sigma factor RsiW